AKRVSILPLSAGSRVFVPLRSTRPGHELSASALPALQRAQRAADAGHHIVPRALLLFGIFQVDAGDQRTRAAAEIATAVIDHSVADIGDGKERRRDPLVLELVARHLQIIA